MTKIAYDSLKLDALKVVEDSKCCLKVNAVITKEGVYPYPDGRAFKSRMELLRAIPSAKNAKVTILDHPDSMVIMSQSQIYGSVEKPFFERDKIRAILSFDKHVCPPKFLVDVRQGRLKDVSIGFYYQPDFTPGTWNGKPYDYVMRDIVIDHVAAGVLKGRCSFPACGIGVDAMMRRIALDPFAGYKDFDECVAKNQDKNDPEAYCAEIKRKVEDAALHYPSQSTLGGKKMNKKTDFGLSQTPEEIEAEFQECVRQRMAEGMTQGEAEAHCQPKTLPESQPVPPGGTLDSEDNTPYQICIKENMASGMSLAEAQAKCKESGVVKSDQDAAFENCVERLMEEGKSREEAEKACRAEHPVAEGDDEPEKTPLERCVEEQMEQGKSQEEATSWCEAELAGEHQATDTLLEHSKKLLQMKTQKDIEERRRQRRNPLQ